MNSQPVEPRERENELNLVEQFVEQFSFFCEMCLFAEKQNKNHCQSRVEMLGKIVCRVIEKQSVDGSLVATHFGSHIYLN